MKKILGYIYIISVIFLFPLVASAQTLIDCPLPPKSTFLVLTQFIVCNINKGVIPVIFSLGFAMFVWGVVKFTMNSSEELQKEQGRQFMIWGVIGLTVMLCVWGLVNIVANTFGVNVNILPQVKTPAATK